MSSDASDVRPGAAAEIARVYSGVGSAVGVMWLLIPLSVLLIGLWPLWIGAWVAWGVVVIRRGWRGARRLAESADDYAKATVTSMVRARPGDVQLRGRIVATEPVFSPWFHLPCVCFEAVISDPRSRAPLERRISAAPFTITDGSTTVRVQAEGAEVLLDETKSQWRTPKDLGLVERPEIDSHREYRFVERLLVPGDEVVIRGPAGLGLEGGLEFAARHGNGPFVITNDKRHPQRQLRRDSRRVLSAAISTVVFTLGFLAMGASFVLQNSGGPASSVHVRC